MDWMRFVLGIIDSVFTFASVFVVSAGVVIALLIIKN